MLLTVDDVTDDRYKLEDRKRKIAQDLNQLTSGKRLERLRNEYQKAKEYVTDIVNKGGNDRERRQLHEAVAQENTFLNSPNPLKLEAAIDQLYRISFQILRRTPAFLVHWFQDLVEKREMFNDQIQAKIS
jgi:molecular chaperone DnaK